jgi:heme/copper-type cytochrome/quinol oxidase subunit 3
MENSVIAHDGPVLNCPEDPQFKRANPGKIGMWLFLTADGMSFSGFLLAYALIRIHAVDWPVPTEALGGVGLSGFMTFWLICSSVSMVFSIDGCKQRNRSKMLTWLTITVIGGAGFLAMQVYEYLHLYNDLGMTFSTYAHGNDLFSATFFSITGFHGLHVLSGTLYLAYMLYLAVQGRFDNGDYHLLEMAGLFWHFVDLVWILVFTFVYLL